MRVAAFLTDTYASGWHRIMWPAEAINTAPDQTCTVEVHEPHHPLYAHADVDVVVVQRPTDRVRADWCEELAAQGRAVVVDLDDDLWSIPASNPAARILDPAVSPGDNWDHLRRACNAATVVTVSTPRLAEVVGDKAIVLENCVPAAWLMRPRADNTTVGWAGAAFSHADDLAELADVVPALCRAGEDFAVVGPADGVGEAVGVVGTIPGTGFVPFDEWANVVAMIGVGVAPLARTPFNLSKSWLRPLTLAAVGVPFVATRFGEYERFGAGILVDDPADWHPAVARLTKSVHARDDLSVAGRRVASAWTYEQRGWRWAEAWAAAYRHAGVAA